MFRKLNELAIGKHYPVSEFSFMRTKFGVSLVGLVRDPDTNKYFKVFFPERFGKLINDDKKLQELNEQRLKIAYNGKHAVNNSFLLDIISE